MASYEEIDAQQRLLLQQRRTLTIYLEQLAQLSTNHAPPGTINGAYEACNHIRQIKSRLEEWGVPVELDASDELCGHTNFQAFLKALQGRRAAMPGAKRAAPIKQQSQGRETEAAPVAPIQTAEEPIKILRVVTEDVARPRNDGTAGSALYAVREAADQITFD